MSVGSGAIRTALTGNYVGTQISRSFDPVGEKVQQVVEQKLDADAEIVR